MNDENHMIRCTKVSKPSIIPEMSKFCLESPLRKFEIALSGGSLFINAHWMAEISPYFAQVCFGEKFAEAQNGRVEVSDVELSDMIELLEYCCPNKDHLFSKKIEDSNLAALIHCSNRFQIPTVQNDLEKFIDVELSKESCKLKAESLIDAILEAQAANYRPSLMQCIYKKLSIYGAEKIQEYLKDFPKETSNRIMEETAKYIKVIHPPIVRHNYDWSHRHNNYNWDQRVFF